MEQYWKCKKDVQNAGHVDIQNVKEELKMSRKKGWVIENKKPPTDSTVYITGGKWEELYQKGISFFPEATEIGERYLVRKEDLSLIELKE